MTAIVIKFVNIDIKLIFIIFVCLILIQHVKMSDIRVLYTHHIEMCRVQIVESHYVIKLTFSRIYKCLDECSWDQLLLILGPNPETIVGLIIQEQKGFEQNIYLPLSWHIWAIFKAKLYLTPRPPLKHQFAHDMQHRIIIKRLYFSLNPIFQIQFANCRKIFNVGIIIN